YALALPFLEKGLEKAKACNSKELLKSAHETFADVFEHLGTPKKAWENYQLFIVYRDSLINEENTEKTVRQALQNKFDKEQANDSIRNRERKIQDTIKHAQEIKQQKMYTW